MIQRVLINHTWNAERSETKWLFWLQKKLEELGIETRIQALDKQDFKNNWFEDIQKLYNVANENVYSIQHDPGCITILTYIKYLRDHEVSDTHLLVAGTQKQGTTSPYIRLEGPKELAIFKGEQAAAKNNLINDAHLVILYSAEPEQLGSSDIKRIKAKA
jgi:predicted alpha/beta hydrolase family esterase